MKLPRKGEIVPLSEIKKLCIYFELYELWDKIAENPPPKPFKSDGCSGGWPDVWKNNKGKRVSIYEACLLHDIAYWSGYKGETMARFLADAKLMMDVARKTKRPELAITMLLGVRTGGVEWLPTKFKWGFGRY